MIMVLFLGLAVGVVVGGSIVFATISWISNHVSTVETEGKKFAVVQTSRVLFSIKVKGN